jgi:hypothetical protein
VKLAQLLGMKESTYIGMEIVRIDVPNPLNSNLRFPSGREDGANPFWLVGGKLPGGNIEAVVDLSKTDKGIVWFESTLDF